MHGPYNNCSLLLFYFFPRRYEKRTTYPNEQYNEERYKGELLYYLFHENIITNKYTT